MALDNGYHFAAQALPTPTDTPYDSPSMDTSIQPSPRGSSFPSSDKAFVPLPPSEDSYFSKQQVITDSSSVDKTSAHESRRFTPNDLGITLVGQIHSLRKELGSKDSMIESLEENVHKSRAENEQLTTDLKVQKAEVTSVKKKMQSLEKEMLQALENIAKERDNALETTADARKRLEDSTRKIRTREEDANKAHALWEKDRQTWDDKRRKLEGRVHIVEERLKTMVAEMLVVQNTDQKSAGIGDNVDDGMKDTWFGSGNNGSDIPVTSRLFKRNLDESDENQEISNFRSSRMSGLHGLGGSQMSGLSLAEELESDEGENAVEGGDSENALPNDTCDSPKPRPEDETARKAMDLHIDADEDLHGDETSGQHSIGIINDYIDFPGKQLGTNTTDIGTQFSPPEISSPQQQQQPSVSGKGIEHTEPTANQSRKRISIPQMFVGQTPALKPVQPKSVCMVSVGSQTVGEPEDPALTLEVVNKTSVLANTLRSTSTQTSEDLVPASKPASSRLAPSSKDVPVIAIHPPASRPSSSRNSIMLPPRTKNAACQVVIELPKNMISNSMQTEETRADRQLFGEPPRLPSLELPPKLPLPFAERTIDAGTVSGLESSRHSLRSPMRAENPRPSKRTSKIRKAFPGENDNGPLNPNQRSGPRRPIRSGSIFAGFDVSSDDDPDNAHDHFSDDEFLNAAPIRKTLSKVQNSWKLVPHLKDSVLERLESASEEAEDEKRTSVPKPLNAKATVPSRTTSKAFHTRPAESYRVTSNRVKQPDIRRKAIVSNGIVKHQRRGRSPSESDVLGNEATIAPPFPVPNRLSSRKVLPSRVNAGPASPSPNTTTLLSARRDQNHDRSLTERNILRKVQSAAAVTQPPVPVRPESIMSMSASSTVPPSPRSTAPRLNQFILPYGSVAELSSHSARSPSRAGETSVGTPKEQTSAVDAIAQTMVGEWMWKYIRKRTSFGITENPQAEIELGRNGDNGNGSGVRHKRWVWLAPFERAVIWSSKQPTSGPALLGKGARKRMLSFKVPHDCANLKVQLQFSRSSTSRMVRHCLRMKVLRLSLTALY